nr:hypothetical protein [Cytophagales bacterium]
MRHYIYLSLFALLSLACESKTEAEKIIDKAIAAHGGKAYERAKISFDFRNISYEIFKSPSSFEYSREFSDSTGLVRDVLNNAGFQRTVNGNPVTLPEDRVKAFSNSVNSVAYFAFLPYGLNDPAVSKTLVGDATLEGKDYHLIKVTFAEEGGGEDFDDEFLYWINKETYRIDYIAYTYHTDGGGVRLRKAINTHEVEGLVFQDYENYKPADKKTPLENMEGLFKAGELELLSEILLEDIRVEFVE